VVERGEANRCSEVSFSIHILTKILKVLLPNPSKAEEAVEEIQALRTEVRDLKSAIDRQGAMLEALLGQIGVTVPG
jgi:hypothetical protein